MLEIIIILLIALTLLGYVSIPGIKIPNFTLLEVNNHPITVIKVITFLVIIWAIDLLPRPFKEIAGVLLILWILSVLGIIALAGLQTLIEVSFIIGIVYYLIFERDKK